MPDYSSRKIAEVSVFSLEAIEFGETDHGVAGNVLIRLSGPDGTGTGPQITVGLAVPCDLGASIARGETALLEGAIAVLTRAAKEQVRALEATLAQSRKDAFIKTTPEI